MERSPMHSSRFALIPISFRVVACVNLIPSYAISNFLLTNRTVLNSPYTTVAFRIDTPGLQTISTRANKINCNISRHHISPPFLLFNEYTIFFCIVKAKFHTDITIVSTQLAAHNSQCVPLRPEYPLPAV